MAFGETYRKQAALLIRALPLVAQEQDFALKGGTAINLFIRDMPRLSVDLISNIVGKMPANHRTFLTSFERGQPDWSLLEVEGAKDLPAVKRRQENLDKATPEKRATLIARLEEVLAE